MDVLLLILVVVHVSHIRCVRHSETIFFLGSWLIIHQERSDELYYC